MSVMVMRVCIVNECSGICIIKLQSMYNGKLAFIFHVHIYI